MQRWIAGHAYGVASIVFFGIFLFGTFVLGWGRQDTAFGLLVYLIVLLGIRVDDIARTVSPERQAPENPDEGQEALLEAVGELRQELGRIRERLENLSAEIQRDRRS